MNETPQEPSIFLKPHDNYLGLATREGDPLLPKDTILRGHILEDLVAIAMNLYLIYMYLNNNTINITQAKEELIKNAATISEVKDFLQKLNQSDRVTDVDPRPLIDQDLEIAAQLILWYDSVQLVRPKRSGLELSFDMNALVPTAKDKRALPNPLPNTHNPEIIARFSMVVTGGLLSNIIDNPDEYSLQLQDLADLLAHPKLYSCVKVSGLGTERIQSINNHLRLLKADMVKSPKDLASSCGLTGDAKDEYCRAIELLKSQTPRQPEPPTFTWPSQINNIDELVNSLFENTGPEVLASIVDYVANSRAKLQEAGSWPE